MNKPQWDQCISHRGDSAVQFIQDYFQDTSRQLGLVAGAGFDPRSAHIAKLLNTSASGRIRALFLREERPSPHANLVYSAEENIKRLRELIPASQIEEFDVFDKVDTAPVGGRRVIDVLRRAFSIDGLTDVVIDCSALSVGVCFSITKYFAQIAVNSSLNVHLTVLDQPDIDGGIEATHCGRPSSPHGFRGDWQLDRWSKAARLWIPQLGLGNGKKSVLQEVHKFVVPHAVCPILPFPASSPRYPDQLIEHYSDVFVEPWQVDARDLIYAHEKSPVDLYSAILRLDDARQRVFKETGGSKLILSPVGSKALALGMLMASLERDFSVVLVESLAYKTSNSILDLKQNPPGEVVHIWLYGDAYKMTEHGGGS